MRKLLRNYAAVAFAGTAIPKPQTREGFAMPHDVKRPQVVQRFKSQHRLPKVLPMMTTPSYFIMETVPYEGP